MVYSLLPSLRLEIVGICADSIQFFKFLINNNLDGEVGEGGVRWASRGIGFISRLDRELEFQVPEPGAGLLRRGYADLLRELQVGDRAEHTEEQGTSRAFTGEILNYLYLANDILQKAKSTENTRLLKAFQPQMPDMVSLICEHNNDRPLFKEILKVSKRD